MKGPEIAVAGRLVRPTDKDNRAAARDYTRRAKEDIVYRAAAEAWAEGVPWAEAMEIASRALADRPAAGAPAARAKGRGTGRGKGRGRGRGG